MCVFLEFAFWCKVSTVAPDHSPAKVGLLQAKVQQGCRHPVSPTLLLGGQQQRRSVVASKGLNVGNGGKTAVVSYSCGQTWLALNPLLLWKQADLLTNTLYFSVQLWRCAPGGSCSQRHWNSGLTLYQPCWGSWAVQCVLVHLFSGEELWCPGDGHHVLACVVKGKKPVGRIDICQRGTGK